MGTIHINLYRRLHRLLIVAFLLASGLISCTKDLEVNSTANGTVGGPLGGTGSSQYEKFLFTESKNFPGLRYRTQNIGSNFGPEIAHGSDMVGWTYMAGIQAHHRQFVIGHNDWQGWIDDQKKYSIREIMSNGEVGAETESGAWEHSYETFFGFHVGDRGFLFGQDSYGDHHWFVQEVTAGGRLADNESDNGDWNNYYKYATPLYVDGKTYLFFQTQSSDNYWFISYVSPEGVLYDVDDGYWTNYWDITTSVEVGGNTYLLGHHEGTVNLKYEWYIQRINSDGTMGEETDRGRWTYYYSNLVGFTSGGRAYVFGFLDRTGMWFIQEITADGKLGTETSRGTMESDWSSFFPFTIINPGGFRYSIGWDLSKANGTPARSWSTVYMDSWSGETKFGGGAALANIDGDAGLKYDTVLMGIQDLLGSDRFYYKVAWNLDATGKAASWSETLYGPACGEVQAGGGADIWDIDGSGKPDLLFMSVDDPAGANSFRYYIGWNLSSLGVAASWSSMIQGPSIGDLDSGGGAALGDIDKNGRPELVLMGIDNPDQANSYWYVIGKNLDKSGITASWTAKIVAPCDAGWNSAGGGAALADINGNGKLDLVLMNIDSPAGANVFWCYVGWDIDINGTVTGWSSFTGPAPGWITAGGGTAVADIDKNGILDLLLMAIDNPNGSD